jgi:hypothetical protein
MADRRLESRYLCADLVRVDWLAGEDAFTTLEAILEDISPHGACVQLEAPIPVGSTISVSSGDKHFTGFVSYCVCHEHGYFVGIRLSDESKWSNDTFQPQHLTNVRTFMGD